MIKEDFYTRYVVQQKRVGERWIDVCERRIEEEIREHYEFLEQNKTPREQSTKYRILKRQYRTRDYLEPI